jgi:hypothetical protein
MNTQRLFVRWLAAGIATALVTAPALASKPVMPATISGTLTATAAGEVVVDGTVYHIQPQSPAVAELATLQPGQSVQVTLSGPVGAQNSQVVEIHATH